MIYYVSFSWVSTDWKSTGTGGTRTVLVPGTGTVLYQKPERFGTRNQNGLVPGIRTVWYQEPERFGTRNQNGLVPSNKNGSVYQEPERFRYPSVYSESA